MGEEAKQQITLRQVVGLAQLAAMAKRQLEKTQRQHRNKRSNGYNIWLDDQGRLGYGLLQSLTREQAAETIQPVMGENGVRNLDLQSRVDGEFGGWKKIWERHGKKAGTRKGVGYFVVTRSRAP